MSLPIRNKQNKWKNNRNLIFLNKRTKCYAKQGRRLQVIEAFYLIDHFCKREQLL